MSPQSSAASGKTAKAGTARPEAAPKRGKARTPGLVSAEDRRHNILEAAYFKAEKRGFGEGGELGDWIEAEAEIDALLDSRGAG